MTDLPINPVVPLTEIQFRGTFPEFGDKTVYPTAAVNMYLAIANNSLDVGRWGEWYSLGVCLFVAHFLSVDARNRQENSFGREPGSQVGPIQGESAGGVSVSYAVQSALKNVEGHWSQTNYGVRFIQEARRAGMGPVQIGIGLMPPLSGPAWPGPWEFIAADG